jgi:hypothetical protein
MTKVPHPTKPGVLISPSRRWQLEQVAKGRCAYCPNPLTDFAYRCNPCALKHRERHRLRQQDRRGYHPWRPGGRGRRPIHCGGSSLPKVIG